MLTWADGRELLEVTFPHFGRVWSINERLHWAPRSRLTAEWRRGAALVGREVLALPRLPDLASGPCTVQLVLPVKDGRRRDPHNYVGTVVKAVVDGLVDAGLWPDDTPAWVSVLEPELAPKAEAVTLRLGRRVRG